MVESSKSRFWLGTHETAARKLMKQTEWLRWSQEISRQLLPRLHIWGLRDVFPPEKDSEEENWLAAPEMQSPQGTGARPLTRRSGAAVGLCGGGEDGGVWVRVWGESRHAAQLEKREVAWKWSTV